jgi:hypothetical protein
MYNDWEKYEETFTWMNFFLYHQHTLCELHTVYAAIIFIFIV